MSDIQDKLTAEVLTSLDDSSKEQLLGKLIGYKTLPPSIDEILTSDYYLGHIGKKLYPIWTERIKEIYPNRVQTKSTIVTVRGALGTGKSTFSMVCTLIDLIRWGFHPDPYAFLGLDKTISPTTIRCFNVDKGRAYEVLVNPLWKLIERSPYFMERQRDTGEALPHNVRIQTAKYPNDVISEVVLGCIFSEVNFFDPDRAKDIMSTVLGRLKSRMERGLGIFPHLFIDSSDTDENSAVDSFLKNNSGWCSDLTVYATSIWKAKAHLGMYFNKGSFKIYLGDAGKMPFVIPDDYVDTENQLDKDRILIVPEELRPSYELDIIKAIKETAGIAVSSGNKFFNDRDRLSKVFNIPTDLDDTYVFDFYDNEEIWDRIGAIILDLIPSDRKLYVRLDLGVSHDNAGISIAYGDRATREKAGENSTIFKGFYRAPVAFAVSRKPGQETCIDKIERFFITLNEYREIASVTTDQYQSTQLRQNLTRAGINTRLMSVDINDNAYVTCKNLILKEQLALSENKLLLHELANLVRVGRHVDHTDFSSKDITDAAFGAVFDCYCQGEDAFSEVQREKVRNYNKTLALLARNQQKRGINRFPH